ARAASPGGRSQRTWSRELIRLIRRRSLLAVRAGRGVVRRALRRQQRQLIAIARARRFALARARLPAAAGRRAGAAQALDLLVKRLDVLELAVHGGEAHIGDLVEMAQLLHHQLTDRPRGYFPVAEAAHLVQHATEGLVDLRARHRALFQRLLHAGAQLRLVERLAPPIALDHHRHQQLGRFEGREALATLQALAAAADLPALAGEARVGHLGLDVAAEGTVHAAWFRAQATARRPGSARTARSPGAVRARSPPALHPRPAPRR